MLNDNFFVLFIFRFCFRAMAFAPSSNYPASGYVAPPGCAALNDAIDSFNFVIRNRLDDTTNTEWAVQMKDDFYERFEKVQPFSRFNHDIECHHVDKEHTPWKVVIFCKTCDKNISADFLMKTVTGQSTKLFFCLFLFAFLSLCFCFISPRHFFSSCEKYFALILFALHFQKKRQLRVGWDRKCFFSTVKNR